MSDNQYGDINTFREAHRVPDTDIDQRAIHHTLGIGPTQAAQGNHGHLELTEGLLTKQDILIGEVKEFPAGAIPAKFLEFNGQSVLRSDYPELFALWGVTFGSTDGAHFNVGPVTADKFAVGNSGTKAVGTTGGSNSKVILEANLPPHKHVIDHDHGDSPTSFEGAHQHDLKYSTSTGAGGLIPRGQAALALTTNNAVVSDGLHAHVVDVNPYIGSSGNGAGTSSPMDITPAWYATRKIVRALP